MSESSYKNVFMLSSDYDLIHDPHRILKSIDRLKTSQTVSIPTGSACHFWHACDFEGRDCLFTAALLVLMRFAC